MTSAENPVTLDWDGEIAILTLNNPPVNALGKRMRTALVAGFGSASDAKAVLLVGDGRGFSAGADISEFGEVPRAPLLNEICELLEASRTLVVASIHGVCLGGGLEVAMAAHYRIAHPSARFGAPEVHLGLIPGAGGTQRLPRLVGTARAVEMITGGRPVSASDALKAGLVDEVTTGEPRVIGLDYVQRLLSQGAVLRATRNLPDSGTLDWNEVQSEVRRRARGQAAPLRALEAIQAGCRLPFEEGMRTEREIFTALLQSDQHKALSHLFFAERATRHLPELDGVRPLPVARLGVVGGGTMGAGIAASALLSGLDVILCEKDDPSLIAARDRVDAILRGAEARGKITMSQREEMRRKRLILSTEFAVLENADIVIEAVVEEMGVKQSVFRKLDTCCKPTAVLATNTSYLDVNALAQVTKRPQQVLGLHFFSPAHVIKLMEVVVPDACSAQTVATGFALARQLGKTAVRSGVCDGFIGNRILHQCRKTADRLVLQGATPQQVDQALERFGYAMGPYSVADLVGLDIGWANRKRLTALQGPDNTDPDFPDLLCETGALGRKSQRGYYLYDATGAILSPNPEVLALIKDERRRKGIEARALSDDEIVRRYLAVTVNEAANILDDGIARRPGDIDVVLTAGYGFPRFRGGPCKWADQQGLEVVAKDILKLTKSEPGLAGGAQLLTRLVHENLCFDDLNRSATT